MTWFNTLIGVFNSETKIIVGTKPARRQIAYVGPAAERLDRLKLRTGIDNTPDLLIELADFYEEAWDALNIRGDFHAWPSGIKCFNESGMPLADHPLLPGLAKAGSKITPFPGKHLH